MSKKRLALTIILSLLIAFLISLIFIHSSKTGNESVKYSDKFLSVPDKFMGLFGIEATRDTLSYIVRKSAHFLEYFALSALLSGLIYTLTLKPKRIFIAPPSALFIAIIDEFVIQRQTFGRSAEIKDVLIDLFGGLVAAMIFALMLHRKSKRSRK